jgi:L-alanine-DL-glutamate epimerase-like enolase superfamily enzyme
MKDIDQNQRRDFFKKAALGGLSLGLMFDNPSAEIDFITQKVNRYSGPSDLKITDMRVAVVDKGGLAPIIKIDTNQGIYGLGEVRDGASWRYALFLKSRLMDKNPCSVEMLFKRIKQFGFHGRQGGGVSAVEMALWDLAGKAYNVPVYQLLGGKYRNKVRLYADTPMRTDPTEFAEVLNDRVKTRGYTFLKMDFGIRMLAKDPELVVNSNFWNIDRQWDMAPMSYGATEHPFTRVQITEKGLEKLAENVSIVRDTIGYQIPLAADHFGHFDVNESIKLARAVEKYQLAWLEDLVPWKYTDMWREITTSTTVPTLTGEDIYLKEEFIKLVDARAVDMIHPDLASAGGILETKKIGDYAEEKGVAMALHFAGTPVSFMANIHCAAATQNFVALEHHSVDTDWWEDIVTGFDGPIASQGFTTVPEKPGLGVDLNEDVIKEHLAPESKYFAPTKEWDNERSWDRLWS